MDEKWKLPRSCSQRNPSSTSKSPVLIKSFSQRGSSSKSSFPSYISSTASSSSHKHHHHHHHSSSNNNSSSSSQASSSSKPALVRNVSRKCGTLAKEQKARFYIMRRCVAMLVCWHKHGDS